MAVPFIKTSFAAGELAPSLFGHVDLAKFAIGLSTARNVFISYRGGAYSRAGTKFVGFSKQTGRAYPPRLITFQFSVNQGLALEFGNQYMRVIQDGAFVTETASNITGITQAIPAVVTDVAHGYANGDWVDLAGIVGMTQLNGLTYVIGNVTPNTYALFDVYGDPIDSTTFTAYANGGTAARIYTLTTPYSEQDIAYLKFTQSADVMSLCCWNQITGTTYGPNDLARLANNNWVLTPLATGAQIAAPVSTVGVADAAGGVDYNYVVTAISTKGEESIASPIADIPNAVDITTTTGALKITWSPVVGASYYQIYKAPPAYAYSVPAGSLFGYAGRVYGTTFVDTNVVPDLAQVPPLHKDPFAPGQIIGVTPVSVGSGLTAVSYSITTAGGSGFHGLPVLVGGQMTGFVVDRTGTGYLPGDTITFLSGAIATGFITFGGNPSDTDTITLNGTVWTFVTTITAANQTMIAGTLAATLLQLVADLSASLLPALTVAKYTTSTTVLTITYGMVGVVGNAYTLAASVATPSGANLTGGLDSGVGVAPTATLVIGPETGTYPSVVAYYQERRVYAATPNQPDTYFMSQPGLFTNFDSRIPTIDSDAIIGTPWSVQVNGIQFMVPMPGGLVVLTGKQAWQLTGTGGSSLNPQAITPSTQQAQPQAFNGCHSHVPPIVWDYDIFYLQAKGSIIRSLSYNFFVNIYTGVDTTYLSSHLFTGYQIQEMAWCEEPFKLIWCVRTQAPDDFNQNGGDLLSFTSVKSQEVAAWARHDTQGKFFSVTSVTEPPVDALYTATQRYPGGRTAFMIERMDNRIWTGIESVWAVDAALSLAQPTPNATIHFSGVSGPVTATASAAVFLVTDVGSVIRSGGGIGTITAFADTEHVTVNFTSPILAVIPNTDPPLVQPQLAGNWTMTKPVTQLSALNHLIGATVTGLADGEVITPRVVAPDGSITLDAPASAIVVGLGFQAQIQSLYVDAGQPTLQGRRKRISAVTVRMEASRGLKTGVNQPDGSVQSPPQNAPTWTNLKTVVDQSATLYTGDTRVPLTSGYEKPGQVAVQQDNPYPMQILALIPEIMPGDTPEERAKERPPQQRAAA